MQDHFRWHTRAIAADERALGLACSSALRSDRGVEETAARIAAVADRRSVAAAIEQLHHSRHDWPPVARATAVRALLRALELHDERLRTAS